MPPGFSHITWTGKALYLDDIYVTSPARGKEMILRLGDFEIACSNQLSVLEDVGI